MSNGVFSSLKILDFSGLLPGPFGSMMLGVAKAHTAGETLARTF